MPAIRTNGVIGTIGADGSRHGEVRMADYRRMNRTAAVIAAALASATMTVLAGCGAPGIPSSSGGDNAGDGAGVSVEPLEGERLADSMQGLIEDMLAKARADPAAAQSQIGILQSAAETGVIDVSDYERSWADYRQCMVDLGNPEPKLIKYSNGIYHQAGYLGGGVTMEKFSDDQSTVCEPGYVMYVNNVYSAMQDNPELYADSAVGVVDCLRRHELVPMGYGVDDYREESRGSGDGTLDFDDPDVMSCQVANHEFRISAANDDYWQDLAD